MRHGPALIRPGWVFMSLRASRQPAAPAAAAHGGVPGDDAGACAGDGHKLTGTEVSERFANSLVEVGMHKRRLR
jgi:hypothetical protein